MYHIIIEFASVLRNVFFFFFNNRLPSGIVQSPKNVLARNSPC